MCYEYNQKGKQCKWGDTCKYGHGGPGTPITECAKYRNCDKSDGTIKMLVRIGLQQIFETHKYLTSTPTTDIILIRYLSSMINAFNKVHAEITAEDANTVPPSSQRTMCIIYAELFSSMSVYICRPSLIRKSVLLNTIDFKKMLFQRITHHSVILIYYTYCI